MWERKKMAWKERYSFNVEKDKAAADLSLPRFSYYISSSLSWIPFVSINRYISPSFYSQIPSLFILFTFLLLHLHYVTPPPSSTSLVPFYSGRHFFFYLIIFSSFLFLYIFFSGFLPFPLSGIIALSFCVSPFLPFFFSMRFVLLWTSSLVLEWYCVVHFSLL